MDRQVYGKSYGGTPPQNYQRYFVPFIGAPLANDLLAVANLKLGERVLDVACGTGVVTRLAVERVGAAGSVAGLDLNPSMLAVARSERPSGPSIDWYEASAESMPFSDGEFDVVICQIGLQFFTDKLAALREMRRVLNAGGRVYVTVPGPKPPMFAIMSDALTRHIGTDAASFVDLVFSMHDVDEISELMGSVGFRDVDVQAKSTTLRVSAPVDFLWQYIHSTPMSEAVARAGEPERKALERDVSTQWQQFVVGDSMSLRVGMTTAIAVK